MRNKLTSVKQAMGRQWRDILELFDRRVDDGYGGCEAVSARRASWARFRKHVRAFEIFLGSRRSAQPRSLLANLAVDSGLAGGEVDLATPTLWAPRPRHRARAP